MKNETHSPVINACRIFLVGMPAVGKTYWGEKITDAYPFAFIDLDRFIAEQEQASVPTLFARYGETGFRERETRYLKKVIEAATEHTVVACGGGTPCFNDNMALMKSAGIVIYLDGNMEALLNNLNHSEEIRPLISEQKDIPKYLEDLLQKRKSIYEQADFILHTKDISLATFDKIISSCINKH